MNFQAISSALLVLLLLLVILFAWKYLQWKLVTMQYRKSQQALRQTEEEEKALRVKHDQLVEDQIRLQAQNEVLQERVVEQRKEREQWGEKLTLQFQVLANTLLEEKSAKFTQQNKEQIDHLLLPLQDQIGRFQQQITATQLASVKSTTTLKEEFQKVNTLYEKMQEEASKATNALMGNQKLQGTWGERYALQLLEDIGLRKGAQYFVQKSFTNEEGKRLIPDILIKLPGERWLLMDVKVTMADYIRFYNSEEKKERLFFIKKHVQALRTHIKQLNSKHYAQAYQKQGPSLVLLLVPLQAAFTAALQHDPALQQEAYEHNVILVSPLSLQGMLAFVEQVWIQEKRNKHALDIAQEGGKLCDKIRAFAKDTFKLRDQLIAIQKLLDQILNKSVEGKGNILHRAEKLVALGARTSKTPVHGLIKSADLA